MKPNLRELIQKHGGFAAVGRAIGVTRGAVWQWADKNEAPIERVAELEKLTGIPRERFRPDIFGDRK